MSPLIAQYIGGAGTGKTRLLVETMEKVVEKLHDPHLIGFVSFTRAACDEAAARAADRFNMPLAELRDSGWFKTLHGIAYRCLGVAGDQLLTDRAADRKWLQEALQIDVQGAADEMDSERLDVFEGAQTDADRALAMWAAARNRLEGLRPVWEAADECDDRTPAYEDCVRIIDRYEQAKRLDDRLDFVDLLGMFGGWRFHTDGAQRVSPIGDVPALPVWIHDEMQDSSKLLDSCFRRLIDAPGVQWVYLAGDPFQCQPAGTKVWTQNAGWKPIEDIGDSDYLVAYAQDGRFYGKQKRIQFRKACRWVDSSELWEIHTEDGDVLRGTTNHQWLCRLLPTTRYATYLMKRGNRWRIGTCQLVTENPGSNGSFRLGQRARLEKSEAAWILRVSDTDKQARIYEQVASCLYGIPQVTFEPPVSTTTRTNLDREYIDSVFAQLGDLSCNAIRCLEDHNLSPLFPIWRNGETIKRGKNITTKTQTCNLLPGLMSLPKVTDFFFKNKRLGRMNGVHRQEHYNYRQGQTVRWVKITKVQRGKGGIQVPVYSLDVPKYATYIADGYVTGNSIFGWSGADHRCFTSYPTAKRKVMPKSWRCPSEILGLGEEILRGCSDYWDRGIEPVGPGGEIDEESFGGGWVDDIDPRQSWLLLARTNYQAARMARRLDEAGIPWHPTKKDGGSKWKAPARATAIKALMNLEKGAWCDGYEWQGVVERLPAKLDGEELLVRGTKSQWAQYGEKDLEQLTWIQPADLTQVGGTQKLVDLITSGRWREIVEGAADYAEAVERWGQEAIDKPGVRVGTVHSAKGLEADNVVVLTTLSKPVAAAAQSDEGADENHRLKYVAVTRAKQRLIIVKEQKARYRWKLPV